MARSFLPKGFLVSGLHCGVKRYNKDLGLIYSPAPCRAAGVFTRGRIKAAPVQVTRDILAKREPVHAVIVNSGNANCCTGRYGTSDAKKMVEAASAGLGLDFFNVCVASTGIIGRRMPIDRIVASVPKLVKMLSEKRLMSFAKAVLTTDRKRKVETAVCRIGAKDVTVTGVCKGAGMIHPNMATMLCFVMTDAFIEKSALKSALKRVVGSTFNAISIEGDMSTNDTVLVLANGQAENRMIKKGTKDFDLFEKALEKVCLELAKDIIRDGEGATKFVTVTVKGAKTEKDAQVVARTIANSPLVKTSICGQDGNWGRVAAAVGASMVKGIKQTKLEIYLDGVCMFRKGGFTNPQGSKASKIYKRKNVNIAVNLNAGVKDAMMYTCDLTKRYIEINAHYST
ncbi:MAG: bifunctional glutamate N-acetyltransferase/amino-acid acetyltransferase ArgJ [Candidatus Omnitrophota bacterium]